MVCCLFCVLFELFEGVGASFFAKLEGTDVGFVDPPEAKGEGVGRRGSILDSPVLGVGSSTLLFAKGGGTTIESKLGMAGASSERGVLLGILLDS